jgi:hypothetical protein
MLILVKLEL